MAFTKILLDKLHSTAVFKVKIIAKTTYKTIERKNLGIILIILKTNTGVPNFVSS